MHYPDLHPLLRTWAKTGLDVLLLSEERTAELRLSTSPATQGPARPVSKPHAQNALGHTAAAQTQELSATSSVNKAGSLNYEHLEHQEQKGFAGSKAAINSASKSPASAAENREATAGTEAFGQSGTEYSEASTNAESPDLTLPLQDWPEAWLNLKNRRPLPPAPMVLWTYAGLEDDLLGTPLPARQQVIARLLKGLQHPGGTHVFWPFVLPNQAPAAKNEASLFWSGVGLLRPRVLIVFGSVARDALFLPRSLRPHQQCRKSGCIIYQLPQPESLLTDEAFRSALAFLSNGLSFCRKNV